MRIHAFKMHCNGNDYIFIEEPVETAYMLSLLAIKISDRHFGLGSDGLVLIQNVEVFDDKINAQMRIFNADGTEAETCGTALMCIAHHLYKKHGVTNIYINNKYCSVDRESELVTVNMGVALCVRHCEVTPCITYEAIQNSVNSPNATVSENITINGYLLNIGNPHFVFFENEYRNIINSDRIWREIEEQTSANVHNITILNDHEISIKIWERGSGFTLSCGSGACVCAFISHKVKNLQNKIKVYVPGGEVNIEILEDDSCLLTGRVTKVYETEYVWIVSENT
jgi:diaminopimelate epimerase